MILEPKQSTIAYRCPSCGSTVMSVIGALSLSGDMIKLKCGCGESELALVNSSDGKVRLTVPCIFCPSPHNYVISRKLLLNRDIFTFSCSYAGMDICFIGSKENVLKAVKDSDRELEELIGEDGMAAMSEMRGDKGKGDAYMEDMIRFVVGELSEENKILCRCGDEGDYECGSDGEKVTVSCTRCGAKRDIYCTDSPATRAFLECNELTLE